MKKNIIKLLVRHGLGVKLPKGGGSKQCQGRAAVWYAVQ